MNPKILSRRHFIRFSAALIAFGNISRALSQQKDEKIIILGDSLSAEYGISRGTGWARLLQKKLDAEKSGLKIINSSISGETTVGGKARIESLLKKHSPKILIIELGSNDALRGLPIENTKNNLVSIIKAAQKLNIKVLLTGMQMPPNYGGKYGGEFKEIYSQISKEYKTSLVPFFLKGVADVKNYEELFQSDGLHPNEKAQEIIMENVWQYLKPNI